MAKGTGTELGASFRRRRFLAVAPAAAAPVLVRARAEAAPARALVREALPNGLLVIAEERRWADTVAMQLTARVGSRDDGDVPGINVITSRMMFQGTHRRPSESDLLRVAAQVGGTLSRGTGAEFSQFSSVVPAGEVDVAFDLLSDLALNPLLDQRWWERQRQVVLQDLARRRADPILLLGDRFQETMFAGHPAGTPVLGTPETVAAIAAERLRANHGQYWGGANLVLTVAGRIAPEDALARAERYFGGLPSREALVRQPASLPQRDGPESVYAGAGEQQAQLRLGFAAPSLGDAGQYALHVLNAMMAGVSGRFFRALRTERGLAYSAGAGYITLADTGAWYATAGVDPQSLDAALEVVRAEITRLREETPHADEVARAISRLAGQEIVAGEGNAARGARLALEEVVGIDSVEAFVHRIREVTPGDVRAVAETYLDLERALLVVVGPTALATGA
ncbi:MAG: M16 family metallopeptidase [Chloroflexota bacterium]